MKWGQQKIVFHWGVGSALEGLFNSGTNSRIDRTGQILGVFSVGVDYYAKQVDIAVPRSCGVSS